MRGLGLLEGLEDLEEVVVKVADDVPITIREIATVRPGARRTRSVVTITPDLSAGTLFIRSTEV